MSAPHLKDVTWLFAKPLQELFAVIAAAGGDVRVAGGAVRNGLMGLAPTDIDLATTLLPDAVIAACIDAGMKVYPTGVSHGTVTVVHADAVFEVTTLRRDENADGRHADVIFTTDWQEDAQRRDFTMNALFCDRHGEIYDFTEGYADIVMRRVRFVGDPTFRIREDYLRILRFFRFHARFGIGDIDAAGLAACEAQAAGLKTLSAERVRVEMLKLLEAPRAAETLLIMADRRILGTIMPYTDDLAVINRLPVDGLLRLVAIATHQRELKIVFKLSNEEDQRIVNLLKVPKLSPQISLKDQRKILYQFGVQPWLDRVLLDRAFVHDDQDWTALLDLPRRWPVPEFPLTGQQLLDIGMVPGPEVGSVMKRVERWWVESDFETGHSAVLEYARTLLGKPV